MFWCYHDPAAHSLSYVNAGHCPPLLARRNGSKVEIVSLQAGGPVLGILPDARYEQARLEVSPGDVLVMYSDGLIEAENSAGQEYGEARLREVLAAVSGEGAEPIRGSILASLAAFRGDTELRDDLTIVVAQLVSSDDDEGQ
jgi:sigma-B regulation protein RsbU (phosphoserine phosphatase)